MKTVTPNTILDYYDGIQIFVANDEIGGQYIAAMVGTEGDYGRYLVAGVSPANLHQFAAAKWTYGRCCWRRPHTRGS